MTCKNSKALLKRFNTLESELLIKHSEEYCYSKSVYAGYDVKIEIICKEHGSFWQLPYNHLKGQGCPHCNHESQTKSNEKFISEAVDIHNGIYSYEKTVYKNNHTKVIIRCSIHNYFSQKPYEHLSGKGCPKCNPQSGLKEGKTKLYYISINQGYAYKIGVTQQSLTNRFKKDNIDIDVIRILEFENLKEALAEEKRILDTNRKYILYNFDLLDKGNTEVFYKDVLGLDTT